MKKTSVFSVIFLMMSLYVSGQANLDSLRSVWNDLKQPDTVRLNAIDAISWDYHDRSQSDSAIFYGQLAYDLAKSKGIKKSIANALFIQARSYYLKGDYTKSIDQHTHALAIRNEIKDKAGIATSLNSIGIIHYTQGNYSSAIDYYTKSSGIHEEIGNEAGIAFCLSNIGIIYQHQGDYARAFEYYRRSLTILEEIGSKREIAFCLNNIGVIYKEQGDYAQAIDFHNRSLTLKEEMGDKGGMAFSLNNIGVIYLDEGNYMRAVEYFKRSLFINEETGGKDGIAYALSNMGLVFKELGDYATAITYYNRSLNIRQEIGDKRGAAVLFNNIGDVYKEQGNYARSLAYGSRSLLLAQEVGSVIETRDAANSLYLNYKVMGRFKPALKMYELYISSRDSINSEENKREVIRQEYKYAYEKQASADSVLVAEAEKVTNAQITAQKAQIGKEKTQKYGLLSGVALLIVFGWFMYRRFTHSQKQKAVIESTLNQLRVTQAQLVQSEKMASLGQLTAGIAHEINNPVNFVYGGVVGLEQNFDIIEKTMNKYDAIATNEKSDKEAILAEIELFKSEHNYDETRELIVHLIEDIKLGVQRTVEIIKGLRTFSRVDSEEKVETYIHEEIDSSLNILKSKYRYVVEIIKQYDPKLPLIKCHPGQISQVLLNVISNAIDAIEKNGIIVISTHTLKDNIMIRINDNAQGMTEEVQKKIFDPFFTTKEIGSGTGLGLSISHGIIKAHGGTIEVKSEIGKGSEFIIKLPID